MKRLVRWLAKSILMLALLYGFLVLGYALWLRETLTPGNLAASRGCWGTHDSFAKAARSRVSRDRLVLYLLRLSPAAPKPYGLGADVRFAPAEYVYRAWWPIAERDRLFVETASRLRSCRVMYP